MSGRHRRGRRGRNGALAWLRSATAVVFVLAMIGGGAVASAPPRGYEPGSGTDALGRPDRDAGHGTVGSEATTRGFPVQRYSPQPPDPGVAMPPAMPPVARGFPDASTTGVPEGMELKPSGSLVVQQDGTVIENLLIVDGSIDVYANNVTIRNVRITNHEAFLHWGIHQRDGYGGLLVEDTEIFGGPQASEQLSSGIVNHGGAVEIRRVEIHSISDGIVTSHGLIEDSYLHSPRYFRGDHTDMVQSNGGAGDGLNLVIRNNTILNSLGQTAAIFLQSSTGWDHRRVRDVLIEGNLLAGGGYTVYGGGSDTTNVVVQGNVFSREFFSDGGRYGPVAYFDERRPGNVWRDNRWDDGARVRLG